MSSEESRAHDTFRLCLLAANQPPPSGCQRTRVISRTKERFLSELNTPSGDKFERNLKYKGTGYFSSKHQPYKTFGDLSELDWSYTHASSHLPYTQRKASCKDGRSRVADMGDHQTMKVQKLNKDGLNRPQSISGGLSSINLKLCALEWSKKELEAGGCFLETADREKKRKMYLRNYQSPKSFKARGHFHKVHRPSIYLKGLSVKNSYKSCLVESKIENTLTDQCCVEFNVPSDGARLINNDRRKTVFPNLIVALAASQFKHTSTKHSGREKMRTELNESQVKQIKKLDGIYSILCFLHNARPKDLKAKESLPLVLLKQLSRKPLHHLVPDYPHSQQNTARAGNNSSYSAPALSAASAGRGRPHHDSVGHGVAGRILLKSNPLWQKPVVYIDPSVEEDEECSRQKISACFKAFKNAQNDLGFKLAEEIERNELLSEKQLLCKMGALKQCGANSSEAFSQMRDEAHHSPKFLEVTSKNKKPEWFIKIEQETATSLKQPHFIRKGSALVNKMKYFTFLDVSSIPHVEEKLCLYFFSVPVYHICTKPVIASIKFVMEEILNISPTLYDQWMEIRGLPLVAV